MVGRSEEMIFDLRNNKILQEMILDLKIQQDISNSKMVAYRQDLIQRDHSKSLLI